MDVSRGHHRDGQAVRQAGQGPVPGRVPTDAVLLELHEDVSGAEGIPETPQQGLAIGDAVLEGRPEGTPAASREEDEPPDPLRVQEGGEGEEGVPPVLSLHVGPGEEAAEVGVTLRGLRQEGEVEARVRGHGLEDGGGWCVVSEVRSVSGMRPGVGEPMTASPLLQPRHRGSVDAQLRSRDGLEPLLLRRPGELHGTVEPVVVREGQGRIAQLLRPQDQLLRMGGTVQEGEARMGVKLDVGGRSGHGSLAAPRRHVRVATFPFVASPFQEDLATGFRIKPEDNMR
jgi:hypothetical protein